MAEPTADKDQGFFCGLYGADHTSTEHYENEWDAADMNSPTGEEVQ